MKFRKLEKSAYPPQKANTFDAGWDLRAVHDAYVPAGERLAVGTGIALDVPQGYVGLIWPRSGLALFDGIDILGGVIDSGYHGEVKVIVQNHGQYGKNVAAGDKIAQILLQEISLSGMHEVEDFGWKSARGENSFGSTGR